MQTSRGATAITFLSSLVQSLLLLRLPFAFLQNSTPRTGSCQVPGKVFLWLRSPSLARAWLRFPQPCLCPPVCEKATETASLAETSKPPTEVLRAPRLRGLGKLVNRLLPPPPTRRELAGKRQGRVKRWVWACRVGPDLGGSQRPRGKAREEETDGACRFSEAGSN